MIQEKLTHQTEAQLPDRSLESLVYSPPLPLLPTTADTSSTGLAARRPALESPLIGVCLFQEHIIAPDEGQQVLVDDVLVGQATSGFTLHWGEHLRGDKKEAAQGQRQKQGRQSPRGSEICWGLGRGPGTCHGDTVAHKHSMGSLIID